MYIYTDNYIVQVAKLCFEDSSSLNLIGVISNDTTHAFTHYLHLQLRETTSKQSFILLKICLLIGPISNRSV